MGRNLDQFEESIRSSVEHFSFPYDDSAWADMEARLDNAGSSGNQYGSLLAAAGFLLLSGLFFVLFPENETTASLPVPSENIGQAWAEAYNPIGSESLDSDLASMHTANIQPAQAGSEVQELDKLNGQSREAEMTSPQLSQANMTDSQLQVGAADDAATTEDANKAVSDADVSDPITPDLNADTPDASAAPVAIALSRQEVCSGEEIAFSVNMDLEGMSYLWIMGDGKFYPDVPNPTHIYDEPGEWNISLSILDAKGKITASKLQAQVIVHATPDAEFSWEFTNDPDELPTVQFLNVSDNASECTWDFGDDDSTSEINPERSYLKRGKKMVKLTAVNEFGCMDETYRHIYIEKDYNLEAPLSLSKSSGLSFMPWALTEEKRNFKLTIYDEKQPIYSTTNADLGWNGSLPSGAKAQPGETYPWVVIIYNRYGEEQEYYSGEINITP